MIVHSNGLRSPSAKGNASFTQLICIKKLIQQASKKYGANAPQLHHISYLSKTNPGNAKKYGANAPQLHHIFPVTNQPDNQGFSKVAQPAHRNRHHCKGGGSAVGRCAPCGRPCSPLVEQHLPSDGPQFAL